MGTFSSATDENRHNSGKFETLNALQNDLIRLLLHSWFSNAFGEGSQDTLRQVHMETLHLFSNHASAARLKCVIMIQIIVIYLLSVCDCQILKILRFCDLWYIYLQLVTMTNSPPQLLFSILLFSKVRYQRFILKRKIVLIKQISN